MSAGVIISASSSNSGKTTISIGIMRALAKNDKNVAPFKCGPDYIDTKFHKIASGNVSINLDLFLSSKNHIKTLFDTFSKKTDFSVVEGAMGLFDGYDCEKGSVAQISKILNLPIVLVIDAAASGFSTAALLSGFQAFDKNIRIGGVIFNNVSSEKHKALLKEASKRSGLECLGCIPRSDKLKMPSRHLGLTLSSIKEISDFSEQCADIIMRNVDLDKLLSLSAKKEFFQCECNEETLINPNRPKLSIGMAMDEAFSFIYEANILAWKQHPRYEISITSFSPLYDKTIPKADMLYFPGGYPELYAKQLSSNERMRNEIRKYAQSGGRILAECGGMMYLCERIDDNKMCGVLPIVATMNKAKLTVGYRNISIQGFSFKGHEFHYSSVSHSRSISSIAIQKDAKGETVDTQLYRFKNVIAGYTHIYWAEDDVLRVFDL